MFLAMKGLVKLRLENGIMMFNESRNFSQPNDHLNRYHCKFNYTNCTAWSTFKIFKRKEYTYLNFHLKCSSK